MTERYDNGDEISLLDENGFIAYRMNEWSMFERYVEFRSSHEIDIVHNELNLVSSAFKMGGTIDRVMQVNGKLLLVDIKTSNAIHPHYWLQLAAYDRLLKAKLDLSVDGIAVLWLNAKTRTNGGVGDIQGKGWQLVIEKDKFKIEQFWRRFQACQDLWLAENESMKPKALQYSIVHKRAETKTL